MDNTKPSRRLHDMITAVIRAQIENRSPGLDGHIQKELAATLFSTKGKRTPPSNRAASVDDLLPMAGLQLVVALEAAQKFSDSCDALLRLRSLDRATKADWCRSLAWHYGYVLRNRVTGFIKLMIEVLEPLGRQHGRVVALRSCYDGYKKRSDGRFEERGRHTHTSQIDDPLLEQVQLLEMMTKSDELLVLQPVYARQAQKVNRHVRSECRALIEQTMDDAEATLGEVEIVFTAVFRAIESRAKKVAG